MSEPFAKHRIQVFRGVTGARALIEVRLGVKTECRREGDFWVIYFDAPAKTDLEFLRPDVLPPRPEA